MRKRLDFKALCYEEELILQRSKQTIRGYGLRVGMKQLASRLNMKTRDVRDYIEHLSFIGLCNRKHQRLVFGFRNISLKHNVS